jgi:hypothetical protein
MSGNDDELVGRMAKKHAVSSAAVHVELAAVRSGHGRTAQFSHADFGASHLDPSEMAIGTRVAGDEVSYRSTGRSADWRPAGLGRPGAVGAQNDLRYAVFPETRRLVIDDRGAKHLGRSGHRRILPLSSTWTARCSTRWIFCFDVAGCRLAATLGANGSCHRRLITSFTFQRSVSTVVKP